MASSQARSILRATRLRILGRRKEDMQSPARQRKQDENVSLEKVPNHVAKYNIKNMG